MDKKKIIKLLEDADICFLGYERNGCRDLVSMGLEKFHEAQNELSKPDWVAVEDELPEYDERVFVRMMGASEIHYVSTVRDKRLISYIQYDENNFEVFGDKFYVTHWRRIDKLEV